MNFDERMMQRLTNAEREIERLKVKESAFQLYGKLAESDLDNNLTSGVYRFANTTAHTPLAGSYGVILVLVSSGITHNNIDNWIWQIGFVTANTTIYLREKINNGAWSAWATFTGA